MERVFYIMRSDNKSESTNSFRPYATYEDAEKNAIEYVKSNPAKSYFIVETIAHVRTSAPPITVERF